MLNFSAIYRIEVRLRNVGAFASPLVEYVASVHSGVRRGVD